MNIKNLVETEQALIDHAFVAQDLCDADRFTKMVHGGLVDFLRATDERHIYTVKRANDVYQKSK